MSQAERIVFLLKSLKSERKISISELRDKFEISDRTIRWDMEYIRDRIHLDITYSKGIGYSITDRDRDLLIKMDLGERILFLSLIKSISKNHFLFPVDYKRISEALDAGNSASIENLTDRISYEMSEEKFFDVFLYDCLIQSIDKGLQVLISYSNLNGDGSNRFIEPQYLRNCDGQWYLLAFCHLRSELRVFHVSRIKSWKLLDLKSIREYSTDELVSFFDSSYGVMTGFETTWTVSILFRNKAIQLVSGKHWHCEQEIEKVPDGVVVSFPVHSFEEVLRVVMSYHSDAEVLEPPEFRELWKNKIREMADKFLV